MAKSSSSRKPRIDKSAKAATSRTCGFCKEKHEAVIDYKDTATLRRYLSDRGKIRSRRVTGNCVQHQRDVAQAVKNSREVALLPFTSTAR